MLITMSEKELHRLGIIKDVCNKKITQVLAALLLNLTRRHIQRLVNQYRLQGALLQYSISLVFEFDQATR